MVTIGQFNIVFFVLALMLGVIVAAVVVRVVDAPDPRIVPDAPTVRVPDNEFTAIYPLPISIFDPRWEAVIVDDIHVPRALLPPAVAVRPVRHGFSFAFGDSFNF
jgi:hypothetical protein